MERNKKLKNLSDRLVVAMGKVDTLRRELLEINKELEALSAQAEDPCGNTNSVGGVLVGVDSMPTFAPLCSDSVTTETSTTSKHGDFGKKRLSDFVSVIDMFRFQRELFGDDVHEMARVFGELEQMSTQSEALSYVSDILKMDQSQEAVSDLLKLTASYYIDR